MNGYYRSKTNVKMNRLNRKPLIPDQKLQLLGYGKIMRPYHIDYGTNFSKSQIDSIEANDSRYMYGSTDLTYVNDLAGSEEGFDSGF